MVNALLLVLAVIVLAVASAAGVMAGLAIRRRSEQKRAQVRLTLITEVERRLDRLHSVLHS